MINWLRFTIMLVVIALLQTCFVHRLSYRGLEPDLLFLVVFYVGLKAPVQTVGPVCGLVGFVRDLLSIGRAGSGMFMFVLAGAALIFFRRRYFSEPALNRILIAFIFVCVMNWLYGATLMMLSPGFDINYWIMASAGRAALTGAIAPLACWMLDSTRVIRPYREF